MPILWQKKLDCFKAKNYFTQLNLTLDGLAYSLNQKLAEFQRNIYQILLIPVLKNLKFHLEE